MCFRDPIPNGKGNSSFAASHKRYCAALADEELNIKGIRRKLSKV